MIDLGLPSGTKWACCNVGAHSPEETGCYYAWGETTGSCEGKTNFDWEYYKYNHYDINDDNSRFGYSLTKYCQDSEYGYNGFTDELTTLESTDDAATVNWGGEWRMPTRADVNELVNKNNTSSTATTINGVAGLLITSLIEGFTDRSIFLPFTGYFDGKSVDDFGSYAEYWTSSLMSTTYTDARRLYITNQGKKSLGYGARDTGLAVRPVSIYTLLDLSLSLTSLNVSAGATANVNITSGNGSYTVMSNDENVATATIEGSSVRISTVSVGTATITVTDTRTGETADIAVTVLTALSISENSFSMMVGDADVVVSLTGGSGTYNVVSSNQNVVRATFQALEGGGNITVHAVGKGTATITVTDSETGGQVIIEVIAKDHLQLAKSSADITVGGNTTVSISKGNDSYAVSSSNQNVATATIDGSSVTITAVSVGTATLTVTDTKTGETVDIAVTVHTPLAISENSLSMMVGDADVVVQLTGGSGTCSVTSSNTNVVRGTFQALEDGGNVTVHAVGKGTATLTVKDTKTGSQVTIEVTAKDHLQLAKSSVDITVGGNTTVNISKGNDSYAVSSSNQNVATATIDGSSVNITTNNKGTAIITVTDTETGETATIDVTVYTPLVISKSTWSMIADYDDEVVRLTGGSGTYTVTSSNQNVVTATIEALDNGGTITVHAVGAGTATITLKDTKTGDQMTMEVTVFAPLILAKKALHLYPNYNKESVYISSGNGGYTAVSSNSSVATAAIDGSSVKITALKKGAATITVTDTQTALTATVEVTVIDHSNDPLTPASPFPSDGAVDVGTSGTFVWLIPTFNGGKGTPYELYLDTDESFSNTNDRPYRTGTGNSCAFTGLKPGTKYYWKVKMDNGRGQSVISEVWNFTTKNQNMYVPIMRGDVNGDKNVTISDVMMIVNHVVTNTTGSNFIAAHADVNGDGNINITDAMMLVRIILNEDTTEPCLEVWHKDGSKIMFSLDEYPKVTYLGDMVTIEAATTVEYEFQAIRKMTFNQSAKTISTTVTPFTRNGETVTFLPAGADLSVRVTLPNGRTLREFVVRKGERATLPLDARIADVYRINVNGVTYKIKTR